MMTSRNPLFSTLLALALGQVFAQGYELIPHYVLRPSQSIEYRGELLMSIFSQEGELHSYDGFVVRPVSLIGAQPRNLFVADDLLYFTAGSFRYTWDGTEISKPTPITTSPLSVPVEFRGSHYYAAYFGGGIGVELGRSGDRMSSVQLVHETTPGAGRGATRGMRGEAIVAGRFLYWRSDDGRLHRYDGTQVAEILPAGSVRNVWSPISFEERLYINVYGGVVPGLYLDEGGGAKFLLGSEEPIAFHGGRDGAPLFVSVGGVEFFAVEEGRLVPIPTQVHPSTYRWADEYSTVAEGKTIVFTRPIGDEEPRWHVLTRDGFTPYAPLADHRGLGNFHSFLPISFGDQIFYDSHSPFDAKLNVIDLGLDESTVGTIGSAVSTPQPAGWTLQRPDATPEQWGDLDDRSRIATAISADLVDLGGGWVWATNNVYYYLGQLPYLYDQTFGTWYYYLSDDSGVYFYNFGTTRWTWSSRSGGGSVEL